MARRVLHMDVMKGCANGTRKLSGGQYSRWSIDYSELRKGVAKKCSRLRQKVAGIWATL
jgi:hypothetical protein